MKYLIAILLLCININLLANTKILKNCMMKLIGNSKKLIVKFMIFFTALIILNMEIKNTKSTAI